MADEVSIRYACWECGQETDTILQMEDHLKNVKHGSMYVLKQYVNGKLAGEQIGSTTAMRQAHEIEMTTEEG